MPEVNAVHQKTTCSSSEDESGEEVEVVNIDEKKDHQTSLLY